MTLDCGIRPSEAFRLLPEDFKERAAEIYIPAKIAKARKSRTLPISDMTVRALRKLLLARPDEWGPDTPIFCTYEGRQMNRHTWGDRLETYSNQLGVHIRPYDLRHVFTRVYSQWSERIRAAKDAGSWWYGNDAKVYRAG